MHDRIVQWPPAQENLTIVAVGGRDGCCRDIMMAEHTLQHRDRVLASLEAARVHLLQRQDVRIGSLDNHEHALKVMQSVWPNTAVNVPGHDPDRPAPIARHGLAPRRVTRT
jgi:hypothetical protein